MQKEDVKPGCYRLTCDLPAISPDRRAKYDWRKAPMTAGMVFAVRETTNARTLCISPPGDPERIDVHGRENEAAAIIENMVPVDEDPRMYLRREWPSGANGEAMGMLVKLFERGTITMADVIAMNEEEKAATRAEIAEVST